MLQTLRMAFFGTDCQRRVLTAKGSERDAEKSPGMWSSSLTIVLAGQGTIAWVSIAHVMTDVVICVTVWQCAKQHHFGQLEDISWFTNTIYPIVVLSHAEMACTIL